MTLKPLIMLCLIGCLSPTAVVLGQTPFSSEPGFKGAATITGQPIQYPQIGIPEIIGRLIEFQPGEETGWHKHTVPTYTHVVEGTLTIEFEDGTRSDYPAGTGLLDAMDIWHTGKNLGNTRLKAVVVMLSAEGQIPLIRRDAK